MFLMHDSNNMAAPITMACRRICSVLTCKFICQSSHRWPLLHDNITRLKNPFVRCLLLSAVGMKAEVAQQVQSANIGKNRDSSAPATETGSKSMTFEADDPRLSTGELLKNAAGLAVDAASAVLSQAVYAITKVEQQYVQLVKVLTVLLEYQLQVLGHRAEEERMADLILETRYEINKVYKRKQDLELLFSSAIKLAEATAEVAFVAGATYASTITGERLYSARREIEQIWAGSQEAEKNLQMVEVKAIEVMTRHAQEQQKRAEEEEEETEPQEESDDAEFMENDANVGDVSQNENATDERAENTNIKR